MERDEQRHASAAETAIDGRPLARGHGERDRVRVAVEQIDVARPTGERTRRVNSVADVLNPCRSIAGDDETRLAIVEAECRNAVILAGKNAGLSIRRR